MPHLERVGAVSPKKEDRKSWWKKYARLANPRQGNGWLMEAATSSLAFAREERAAEVRTRWAARKRIRNWESGSKGKKTKKQRGNELTDLQRSQRRERTHTKRQEEPGEAISPDGHTGKTSAGRSKLGEIRSTTQTPKGHQFKCGKTPIGNTGISRRKKNHERGDTFLQ